jgi:hypothetical protein
MYGQIPTLNSCCKWGRGRQDSPLKRSRGLLGILLFSSGRLPCEYVARAATVNIFIDPKREALWNISWAFSRSDPIAVTHVTIAFFTMIRCFMADERRSASIRPT